VRVLLEDSVELNSNARNLAVASDSSAKPDVNKQTSDDSRYTPLHLAARGGHHQVVRLLIEAGAHVNVTTACGCTALHLAAACGNHQTLESLLARGAQADATNADGISALQAAAVGGHLEASKVLVEHLTLSGDIDNHVSTALTVLSAKGFDDITRTTLRVLQVTPHAALMAAICSGDAQTATVLVNEFGSIDRPDDSGRTFLGMAVELGHASIVEVLLEKNACCDYFTPDLRTAWNVAFRNHRYDGIELLSDARSRAKDPYLGSSASLLAAAIRGDVHMVSLRLKNGCPVNIFRNVCDNPLIAAQKAGHMEIVAEILHERWADPMEDRDQLGRYRNHVAAACGLQSSLVAPLVCSVDLTDKQLWTPLHWAAYFGQHEMCHILIRAGADAGARDWQGWIPAQVARFASHSHLAASIRPRRFSWLAIPGLPVRRSECSFNWHCDACSKVRFRASISLVPQCHGPLRFMSDP
jgi:ankyrin repeat protein